MRHACLRMLCVLSCLLLGGVGLAHGQSGTISGVLRDAASGNPVVGARVEAVAPGGGTLASATTDASGRYTLSGLPAGRYTLLVTGRGFEPRRLQARLSEGGSTTASADIAVGSIQLDPLVVSASKREEKALNAPARVEVVGAEAIEVRPALSAVDHLRTVAGVDVASTGVQSSNVVARGFNNIFSGSLHVLTDNRIAGVPSLRVNFMHFIPSNSEDVERMEVVLGPGAALYGPNTADGILHVITRSPLDHQGTTVSAAGGEQDVFHGTFRTSHLVTPTLGVKASGQYLRAQEWRYTDPGEVAERTKFDSNLAFFRADLMRASGIDQGEADRRIARIGNRDFDVERWSGEVRADWRPLPELTTVFTAGTATQERGVELTGLGASQTNGWRSTFFQGRASWNRLFAQLYLNTSDAGDTYLLRNGAPIVDRSRLLVGQLQHGVSLGERQRFTYGGDYVHTMPETEGTINGGYENDDETREYGAYLQSETALHSRLDLVLAGRVDTHSALPDPIFSPRAALVWKPGENQAFRVSFNRAFSTPSSLNQFLDLGSAISSLPLAQLGYSIRVQGTGENGFTLRQPDGGYLMRSPFTPAALGGPGTLLPADAASFWSAAVGVVAAQAAANGSPLPGQLVQYLAGLRPTGAQVGTNYLDIATGVTGPLSQFDLAEVAPIRESTSTTIEAGYKGIVGGRLLLAVDVWRTDRENFVTPLMAQTPLLLLNGPQVGAYLVPRLMSDLGMSQAQATALAQQLATGMAQVPLGTVSSADVNANGAQVLVTYRNVEETIRLWGADVSATALLGDRWSLGMSASLVSDDRFATTTPGVGIVTLNAPARKGSLSLAYRGTDTPWNAEARVRYTAGFPAKSGVYQATRCVAEEAEGPLTEDCISAFTLMDVNVGRQLPRVPGATLQLAVQNLLNEDYRAYPGSPTLGRMALLRLRYEF